MGKRKYDDEARGFVKRSKVATDLTNPVVETEQPQNDHEDGEKERITIKPSLFNIKHFRKELAEKQGQTMALTQFLQVCLNPDSDVDYLLQYLKVGGNSHEILRQISQENKKNITLATPAFHLFHLIILKVQSTLPHMIAITEEACRYFLNTFTPTIEIMISENSGPRHRKIVLNLLTSMVTLNSDLGIEVLHQVPLTPKNLHHIVEKPNYKEKDNVRTAFVHFMTSFLVDGHLPLIKALLEKQGLLSLLIPGLVQDEAEAVLMFLNILKKNVIDATLISKTLKLKTFNHQVLHNLFKLFMWKGPPERSKDQNTDTRNEIMTSLSDIILTLFTSHKLGLYFPDHTLGTSDANKNQNLYKALQSLKRPWESDHQCEAILQIIVYCPDLHRAIINVIEQNFQPEHTPIWERTMAFVIKLLDKLKPDNILSKMSNLNSAQTANFIRFVTMPVPLLKLLNTGIEKDLIISLYCIKVLVKMLQTLKRYMQILELEESSTKFLELKNKFDNFLPKHMPTPNTIVCLINNVINDSGNINTKQDYRLPKLNNTDSMLLLLDLLLLYNYIYPASFEYLEGIIDMKKILDFSMTLTTGHISLLKFKIVSLWLMLDKSTLTIKNSMFRDLFIIMLEVYVSQEYDIWREAKDTLYIFFKNTEIFESDEDEIHLMLYTLRNSKTSNIALISDIVEYILANKKDLFEYNGNQTVNFEIFDEKSKENLNILFNDLMHNRNTEDSIFLENKIPSMFITGCMQYVQNNKDAKKNLKSFLNLYVANLLHCNYSPELTEVLIGDCKLDIRSYVAHWMVQPVHLPEGINKDETLYNISKSIITNEDILFTNIFPLIESSDEFDINIMDVTYKIDMTKPINSTDLFVWAKYLMFCIVRLANIDQLSENQRKKIVCFFEIIIELGKKHHMINICRHITLNLFKNAHILKIFQPMDLSKRLSITLATELLLQIMVHNKNILDYLNKKYYILKSYQQKTFNEITKAFNKINKRKNLSGDVIIRVLNLVELSKEDDLQVFKYIFSTCIENCFKEDKEPSLVLELLRLLVDKYSKTTSTEFPTDILKKCMNLYFNLLTLKSNITPNLTNLEESLISFFENKPHQITIVSEDDFKMFFHANTVRKTTSQLACILLKFNIKLCNVFKSEIIRSEILSHREITLPLGSAVIDHDSFVLENKDVLYAIYGEYKSNINKFLSKPHKAGQVYINSAKLIKRLVIEFMNNTDSLNFFSKYHKFEIVESSHVDIIQVIFLKLCLITERPTEEHLINYLLSMLHLTMIAVKENNSILNALVKNIRDVIQVRKLIESFKMSNFKKITESSVWQNFCKTILKDSLKVRTVGYEDIFGPSLLSLLSSLVNELYPSDHEDIVTLFDMVTSHSEFLNIMLSLHSPNIKTNLLEFLFVLISKNKSVMKTQQIPVYLSAYHATRSHCDRLILSILQFYETNDLPVNDYKPYIWGDSAANYYAVRKRRTTSLWSHPTPNQVMNLFEKEIVEKTVMFFPVNQKLDYDYELAESITNSAPVKIFIENTVWTGKMKLNVKEEAINMLLLRQECCQVLDKAKNKDIVSLSHVEENKDIYDPAFLLPLLSNLLAPGSVASCFKLLRSGLLSIPVMGLSSHCPLMRAAAYHVLHRFCMLLETETRHKNDKLLLTDFITTLRHSLSTAIVTRSSEGELKDIKNPQLPSIGALYLGRALMVSTSPTEPLYKPVNNFFIARQFVDLTLVPDFLSLFHDSEMEAGERRLWILDIIKHGTKTMTDINTVFKTMCLKMIMDFYSTMLSDRKTKVKIISTLNSIINVPRAFEILVEGYSFMAWLHYVVRNLVREDLNIVKELFVLIENMIHSMRLNLFARYCSKFNINGNLDNLMDFKIKSEIEYDILNIIYDLLPHVELLDIEDMEKYVKLYNLITKKTIKFLTKRQIVNVVNTCIAKTRHSECLNYINQAVFSNNPFMLSSKIFPIDIITVEDRVIKELTNFVNAYVG